MRVLVTGANGFLGSHIVTRLRRSGHDIVGAVRRPAAGAPHAALACDFTRDTDPRDWLPRLSGIDAVVNCAGILRESRRETFQSVHVDAPLALFRACVEAGVRRVVQISALGEPEDGEFIASKHRCDAALSRLDLDWIVLRPGLVYSAQGAYGGTSLLRAMAVLPGLLLVPGDGLQQLRPLAAEDLADGVASVLANPRLSGEIVELVGAESLTLREYLSAWRAWFGLGAARVVGTPKALVGIVVALGERFGRGPVCRVIANLLERRRVGGPDALHGTEMLLGRPPQRLAEALQRRACDGRDFVAARWDLVRMPMLFALALVWIGSGIAGLLAPPAFVAGVLPGWPPALVHAAGRVGSVVDLVLGIALALGSRRRLMLALMLASLVVYTLVLGIAAPASWLDPSGALLKNVPIAALLFALLVVDRPRA